MADVFRLFVLLVSSIGHRFLFLIILFGDVFVKKRRRSEAERVLINPTEMWPMF